MLMLNTEFEHQGASHKSVVARDPTLPVLELTEDNFRDARMDDGVETVKPGAIGKHNGAEFSTVDAAIRGAHRLSEFLEDLVVGRLAWLDESVSQGVGVQDRKALFTQHG